MLLSTTASSWLWGSCFSPGDSKETRQKKHVFITGLFCPETHNTCFVFQSFQRKMNAWTLCNFSLRFLLKMTLEGGLVQSEETRLNGGSAHILCLISILCHNYVKQCVLLLLWYLILFWLIKNNNFKSALCLSSLFNTADLISEYIGVDQWHT